MRQQLLQALAGRAERAFEWQQALTAFGAYGPDAGGPGEWKKAAWLEDALRALGITHIEHINAPDERVPEGKRPNLVIRFPGKSSQTLWVLAHLDVVPPGDLSLWHTDPWTVVRDLEDPDCIRGRGVEDNQQAIVAGCLVLAELAEQKSLPDLSMGLILVSDEETGNVYGVEHVLRERPNLIAKDDLVIVPDFGTADASLIEVAEKGVLWIKATLTGKQCHGSTPAEGRNTLIAAADMILGVAAVEQQFGAQDPLFSPPHTTLTPTKCEANVPNINTISGKDVFYIDCRILPQYAIEDVYDALDAMGQQVAQRHGVTVELAIVNSDPPAPPTPVDSPVVKRLMEAVRTMYGVECHAGGVGGATVAAPLRRKGIQAAVWSRIISNFHQPNEASRLSYAVGDARVFASLLFR